MALIKNIVLMGASTAMRLACGLLTFVVMARFLGPDQFGLLMLWLSAATLLSLFANYGFTTYLLRELGANPSEAVGVMSEVLTAKFILNGLIAFIGLTSIGFLKFDIFCLFLVLLAAQLTDSMTEFFNVGYRATNRYGSETQLASIAAVIQLVLVTAACMWRAEVIMTAGALLIARLLVLFITWRSQMRYFNQLRLTSWQKGWQKIKQTHAFASDFALQSLFGQIDSLVLNHFLGPASVGVYQAGMRIFLAGTQAATVLGNVFIPAVSSKLADSSQKNKGVLTLFFTFNAIGILGFTGFYFLKFLDGARLFGEDFLELNLLFPYFGLLFAARFLAASSGCILTISGMQKTRATCTAVHWVLLALLILTGIRETKDWIVLLIIVNFCLAGLYAVAPTIISLWKKMKRAQK